LTLAGSGWDRVNYPVMTLIAYAIAMLVTSLFLFATVWES
jgi:hypothetical protein